MQGTSGTEGGCGGSRQAAASEEQVSWKGLKRKQQQIPKLTTKRIWFYGKQGLLHFLQPKDMLWAARHPVDFQASISQQCRFVPIIFRTGVGTSFRQNKPGRKRRNYSNEHQPSAASLFSSQSQRNPTGPALPKHTVPSGKSIWPHPCYPWSCCQCLNRGH